MKLNHISIKNFKSIQHLDIDFRDVTGLWKIVGATGSGKTSVGEAIIFGLFGDVKGKKKEDLIRWGETSAAIDLELTSKGRTICISRVIGNGSKVSATIDGAPLDYTNKADLQKQLENDRYDITRNTLETLCLISFNNFKSLIKLNAFEMRQFLDQTLGLYLLTGYSDAAKELRKDVQSSLNEVTSDINVINSKINEIAATKKQIVTENIDQCLNDAVASLNDIKDRANKKLETLSNECKTIEDKITEVTVKLNEANFNESTIRNQGIALKQRISQLQNGICPTCNNKIPKETIDSLNAEKVDLTAQWQKANALVEEVKAKLLELNNERNKNIDDTNKVKNALNVKVVELNAKIAGFKKEQEFHKFLEKNNKNFMQELQVTEQKLDSIKSELDDWNTLIDFINVDMRNKVISQYVPMINKEIAKLSIALNQPYTIVLNSDFSPSISIGDIQISTAALSTGQSKTIDMIIVLATVKSLVGNMDFNVFFLDELFSNMDADLRNDMCTVLNDFINNKTIFVISHADIDDRYFNGSIEVKSIKTDMYSMSSYSVNKFR